MLNFTRRLRLFSGVAIASLILVLCAGGKANAQAATEAQIKALQAQVEALTRTVKELKEAQTHTAADAKAAKKQASQADANAALAKATAADTHARAPVKSGWLDSNGHTYFEHKPGSALTFFTPGGEITAYGQFDVSADYLTKNAKSGLVAPDGSIQSEISAGCLTSRPTVPISACVGSNVWAIVPPTLSTSSNSEWALRRLPA